MNSAYGLESVPDENWRLSAACQGYDPEWWTITGSREQRQVNETAKAICAECPVSRECRDFAERTGCWGLIFGGVAIRRPNPRAYVRMMTLHGRCDRCGEPFVGTNSRQRFCSDKCRSLAQSRSKRMRVVA